MKNGKKTIVIVGTLLITIIVIVGSVVIITKINKNDIQDNPMSPVVEKVVTEKEAETIDIKLDIYDQLVNGITRPPEVDEVLDTNEETGETMFVTTDGDVALVTKPEEDTRTDEEILADLDNIWYEVNGVSKDEENVEDVGSDNQVAADNNTSNTEITNPQKNEETKNEQNTNPTTQNDNSDYPEYMKDWDWGEIETPEDQKGKGSVGEDINSDVTFH